MIRYAYHVQAFRQLGAGNLSYWNGHIDSSTRLCNPKAYCAMREEISRLYFDGSPDVIIQSVNYLGWFIRWP